MRFCQVVISCQEEGPARVGSRQVRIMVDGSRGGSRGECSIVSLWGTIVCPHHSSPRLSELIVRLRRTCSFSLTRPHRSSSGFHASLIQSMKTMSSPVSPSALFSTSPSHVPSPPLSFSSLPTFPIEVQKRILYHALALPPLYPIGKYDTSYPVAGQAARQREVRRVVERLNIHRAALTLKRVCKAWKVIPLSHPIE